MRRALFYRTYAGEPHYNMTFDEWLFRRVAGQAGAVYLHLYTWSRGAITFGLNQRRETALDGSKTGETSVIRRITGGRALFHDPSELTYALAVNSAGPEQDSLAEPLAVSSKAVAKALKAYLVRLGIECAIARNAGVPEGKPGFFHKAPCFASTSRHELVAAGQKVAASAQRRIGGSFLQHGSLKIRGVARHPALGAAGVGTNAENGFQVLNAGDFNILADLFGEVVGSHLDLEIEAATLTEEERVQLAGEVTFLKKNSLTRRGIY